MCVCVTESVRERDPCKRTPTPPLPLNPTYSPIYTKGGECHQPQLNRDIRHLATTRPYQWCNTAVYCDLLP